MTAATVAVPAAGESRASRARSIRAIARVEAGRLLRHPAFLVGLAGSVAAQPLYGGSEEWGGQNYYASVTAWTFLWVGALVAGALVAGRERVLGDTELFPATPATPGDRALGTALALVGPVLAAAAAVTVVAAVTTSSGGFVHGDDHWSRRITPHVVEWAQPILLVAVAGAVGIAVAQLRRARLATLLVATILTFFGGTAVWALQAHPLRVLHPFMYPAYQQSLPESFAPEEWAPGDPPLTPPGEFSRTWHAIRFDTAALSWHLVYLVGLVLVGVAVAARTADRGERPSPPWLAVAGVPLVVVGGLAQVLTAGVAS